MLQEKSKLHCFHVVVKIYVIYLTNLISETTIDKERSIVPFLIEIIELVIHVILDHKFQWILQSYMILTEVSDDM